MKNLLIKILRKFYSNKREKPYLAWCILTIDQLQYKFNALKNGTEKNKRGDIVYFNLRRNIHRLEKGLSYAAVKSVFASEYIVETVCYLEQSLDIADKETLDWANSVLGEYFAKCSIEGQLKIAKQKFDSLKGFSNEKNHKPYLNAERPALNVTYDDLLSLSIRRRSVRYFSDQVVEDSIVKKAYEIAKYAPSACNRQAFQYLFFNEPNIVNQLAATPGGVRGYSLPSLVVLIGRYDGYFDIRDINAPIIDASLSAMGFLYACETLGLGTVCINWPNLNDREEKIRNIIQLEPSEFVVMMIGIGYPLENGKIPYSEKRSPDEIVLVNERVKNRK